MTNPGTSSAGVVKHRTRLLSDNGPCYLSKERKQYLNEQEMEHTRGAPYHLQTLGRRKGKNFMACLGK